jgi:hypothetical protein
VVGLIAECERRTGSRADFIKSCLELMNPDVSGQLSATSVGYVVGDECDLVALEASTDNDAALWYGARDPDAALAKAGSPLGLLSRCATANARVLASDLLQGRTNIPAVSPSGWHSRSLGSPTWDVPPSSSGPPRPLTPLLPVDEPVSLSNVTVVTHALRPMMSSTVWVTKQCSCFPGEFAGRPPCVHGLSASSACVQCTSIEQLTADDHFEVSNISF